jgi:hypothetical protein
MVPAMIKLWDMDFQDYGAHAQVNLGRTPLIPQGGSDHGQRHKHVAWIRRQAARRSVGYSHIRTSGSRIPS